MRTTHVHGVEIKGLAFGHVPRHGRVSAMVQGDAREGSIYVYDDIADYYRLGHDLTENDCACVRDAVIERRRIEDYGDPRLEAQRAAEVGMSPTDARRIYAVLRGATVQGVSAWAAIREVTSTPRGSWGETMQALTLWSDRTEYHGVSREDAARAAYVLGMGGSRVREWVETT